mmetsp:Transcript_20569/g.36556  ORF Transcript_20569/g.36556 Transcript_20569/m.36556 type:complete len:87 (+) Transcript_20569:846-1106(+)
MDRIHAVEQPLVTLLQVLRLQLQLLQLVDLPLIAVIAGALRTIGTVMPAILVLGVAGTRNVIQCEEFIVFSYLRNGPRQVELASTT